MIWYHLTGCFDISLLICERCIYIFFILFSINFFFHSFFISFPFFIASPETFELLKSLNWPFLPDQNDLNDHINAKSALFSSHKKPLLITVNDIITDENKNDNNDDTNNNILTQLLEFSPEKEDMIKKEIKIDVISKINNDNNIKKPLSPKKINTNIPTPLKATVKEMSEKDFHKLTKKSFFSLPSFLSSQKVPMVINENEFTILEENDIELKPKQLYMDEI